MLNANLNQAEFKINSDVHSYWDETYQTNTETNLDGL
jgi:hypothetical protein